MDLGQYFFGDNQIDEEEPLADEDVHMQTDDEDEGMQEENIRY
jgi:hypothetical protein